MQRSLIPVLQNALCRQILNMSLRRFVNAVELVLSTESVPRKVLSFKILKPGLHLIRRLFEFFSEPVILPFFFQMEGILLVIASQVRRKCRL